ncbi:MAG: hypothetical protein CMM93_05930 [Rickettsiales bacterium]|nr:hypothetical protein [Rickettsiales bacterium]|tara:strand:- start:287 stop:532 length:246 start_codon:yes stop_codon:yes gene_type:complete
MSYFEYGITFIVSWWMILFFVLPFKTEVDETAEAHIYHGAPKFTYLKQKLWITTGIAVFMTFILAQLIKHDILSLWIPYHF